MISMREENTLFTRPRYGFRLINNIYVEHEEEQKVISAIKAIISEKPDISNGHIIKILDEEGFKNKKGNKFHVTTIKSIINEINNPSNKEIVQLKDVKKNKNI